MRFLSPLVYKCRQDKPDAGDLRWTFLHFEELHVRMYTDFSQLVLAETDKPRERRIYEHRE